MDTAITRQRRGDPVTKGAHMQPVIIAMTLAAALAAYWINEELECLLEPGTDYCLQCGEECLEPTGNE